MHVCTQDILVDRLRREYNVSCDVGAPQVCLLWLHDRGLSGMLDKCCSGT